MSYEGKTETQLQDETNNGYDVNNLFVGGETTRVLTDTDWRNPPRLVDFDTLYEVGKLENDESNWQAVNDDDTIYSAAWFYKYNDTLNSQVEFIAGTNTDAKDNNKVVGDRDDIDSKTNPNNQDPENPGGPAGSGEPDDKSRLDTLAEKYGLTDTSPNPGTEADETAFAIEPILKYPHDHAPEEYDFIKIIPIEYVPALTGQTASSADHELFGFKSVTDRYRNVKKVGSTVFLPMTPDISESNSVDWGSDRLNPIQAAAGQIAVDTFNTVTAGGGAGQIANTLVGSTVDAAQAFSRNDNINNFIKAYFAGKAVNANLLGRAGIAINPNLEVLFNGPALRTFSYNFKFTPRDREEARIVRKIIKVFKKTMAVKRRDKVFLSVPAVYKIQYVYNTGFRDHPFLNKIKPCALSSFNVSYAPDGSYMTYQDGSMTSYSVQMKFDELEPVYNDDINDVDDPTTGF